MYLFMLQLKKRIARVKRIYELDEKKAEKSLSERQIRREQTTITSILKENGEMPIHMTSALIQVS